jgi:hypothetical protein
MHLCGFALGQGRQAALWVLTGIPSSQATSFVKERAKLWNARKDTLSKLVWTTGKDTYTV